MKLKNIFEVFSAPIWLNICILMYSFWGSIPFMEEYGRNIDYLMWSVITIIAGIHIVRKFKEK